MHCKAEHKFKKKTPNNKITGKPTKIDKKYKHFYLAWLRELLWTRKFKPYIEIAYLCIFLVFLNIRRSTFYPNINLLKFWSFFLHCSWTDVQTHKSLFWQKHKGWLEMEEWRRENFSYYFEYHIINVLYFEKTAG